MSFWNTSRVTNMERAFYDRSDFNEDIGRWDVSNVTNMGQMFYGAPSKQSDEVRETLPFLLKNGSLVGWGRVEEGKSINVLNTD